QRGARGNGLAGSAVRGTKRTRPVGTGPRSLSPGETAGRPNRSVAVQPGEPLRVAHLAATVAAGRLAGARRRADRHADRHLAADLVVDAVRLHVAGRHRHLTA